MSQLLCIAKITGQRATVVGRQLQLQLVYRLSDFRAFDLSTAMTPAPAFRLQP